MKKHIAIFTFLLSQIYFYPQLICNLEFKLEAYIVDNRTGAMLPNASLRIVGNDGTDRELFSDENGMIILDCSKNRGCIEGDFKYALVASLPDYLVAKHQISTLGSTESKTFILEFLLEPVTIFCGPYFPDFYFALEKENILQPDKLEFMLVLLEENPTITVEFQGHIESRECEYDDLSQRRAEACVNYLIEKGIDEGRLKSKGFGSTEKIISDEQIDLLQTYEEKEEAHQKNRRVEFTVLSWDWELVRK